MAQLVFAADGDDRSRPRGAHDAALVGGVAEDRVRPPVGVDPRREVEWRVADHLPLYLPPCVIVGEGRAQLRGRNSRQGARALGDRILVGGSKLTSALPNPRCAPSLLIAKIICSWVPIPVESEPLQFTP